MIMEKIKNSTYDINPAFWKEFSEGLNHELEIQNIDVMKTAGFCRNCLSRWYREEANELGLVISEDESKEIVYGMPYKEWKEKFQK